MPNRPLLSVVFACLANIALFAQSYQTSFSDVSFDRAKGPSTVHGGVEIEGATGAVKLNIPLGPGIGARGISFRPALTGRMASQVTGSMANNAYGNPYQVLTPRVSNPCSFFPGVLDLALSLDTLNEDWEGLFVTNYLLPGGGDGSFNLNAADGRSLPASSEIQSILQHFKYEADVIPSLVPWRTSIGPSTTSFVRRDDAGSLVIGLVGSLIPEQTASNTSANMIPSVIHNDSWHFPGRILVVRGEVAYEYLYLSPSYQRTEDPFAVPNITYANVLRSGHFVLNRILNRFGESLEFAYDSADSRIYTATWKQGGISTGIAIQVTAIPGGGYQVTYQGVSPAPTITLMPATGVIGGSGKPPADSRPGFWPAQVIFSDSQETITFGYTQSPSVGYNGPIVDVGQILSSVTFPTHRVNLTWTNYLFLRNQTYPGQWTGYQPINGIYNPAFAYGVNRVDDTDLATNQVYTTTHTRVLPQPNLEGTSPWGSTSFYDAVQNPDGSVVVTRFMEPIQGPLCGAPADTPENQMQTLAHLKHLVSEVRAYEIGTSVATAQADLANAPAQSSAYKIVSSDRWDLHSIGNPTGSFTYSAVPHPTRTRTWTRESQVLVTEEHTDWDAVNLGWKTHHKQAEIQASPGLVYVQANARSLVDTGALPGYPTSSGAAYRSTASTFETILPQWFLGRTLQSQETAQQDGTGNVITTLPSALPPATKTYENDFNRVTSVKVAAPTGNSFVQTDFAYTGSSLNNLTSSQVQNVTLTGSSDLALSGQVGVQLYQYDALGFMSFIQPKGVTWNVQQGQDGFGRPTSQTDANGKVTHYTWDGVGRLTSIQPPDNMVSTSITYNDTDHRGITLTRGAQTNEYRYDGMGRLVLVRRWDGGGTPSHKVISYDLGGRKTFESVWLPLAGSDTEGLNPAGLAGVRWVYDGQGRVTDQITDHDAPKSSTIHTDYLGLTRSVTAGYGSADAATTTYVYDAPGRLVQVTSPKAKPTDTVAPVARYKYDQANRIAKVEQVGETLTQVRTWGYHPMGWLQSLTQPESGTTTYSQFTVTGMPEVTTYTGDGTTAARVVTTIPDPLMRPLTITSADGTVDQAFQYDDASGTHGAALNRLWYARDKGTERVSTFSGLGGALSRLDTNIWTGGAINVGSLQSFPQTFSTDSYGHRVQSTAGQSTVVTGYDLAKDVPISLSRNSGSVVSVTGWETASWNPTRLDYGNGAVTIQSFDIDQTRLSGMMHYASGTQAPSVQWSYLYDGRGNLKTDGADTYTYDFLDRLTSAVVQWTGGTLTQAIAFDSFGNITSKVATGNLPSALITGANLNNFSMNSGEQATMAATNRLPATASGVPTGAQYDGQGNMTQVFITTGDSSTQVGLQYDALGRVTQLTDAKRGVVEKYQFTTEGLRSRIEEWQGTTLLKVRFNVYNDARQLVSQSELLPVGGSTIGAQSLAVKKGTVTPQAVIKDPAGASIMQPLTNSTVAVGQSVSFVGETDFGTTLIWNFGDGGGTSGLNASHTYTTAGTRTVTFTASGTGYTTSKATITLNVVSVPPPTITSFTTNASTIPAGSSATLSWNVTGASGVSISPVVGSVGSTGSVAVSPSTTTTYTLTANSLGGTVTQALTVTVVQAPTITSFSASPTNIYQGDGSTLSWNVSGATSLSLDQGLGSATGTSSRWVSPTSTTNYTLTATNTLNGVSVNRTATATVTVSPRPTVPSINSFTADAGSIGAGQGTTLRWNVSNAVGAVSVSLSGVGTVSTVGTQWVAPTTTTTYTLTATNSLDSTKTVSASVTVTVVQKPVITLSADQSPLFIGQSTTLRWSVANGPTSVGIDQGIGTVGASGAQVVSPTITTMYTLTASNLGGTTTSQVTVSVTPLPVISSLTASPNTITRGRSSILTWAVQGAASLTVNGVAVTGTQATAAPTATKAYTLAATNGSGTVTSTVTVTVNDDGTLVWKRDIVYMGAKEMAEFDAAGMHVTHLDHLGSPRMVTGPTGSVESRPKYTPFGETLDLGSNPTGKGFTNHEQTDPIGLIYMQARFYAPGYGRFLSPDPARDQHFEETQSWNIYSYVQNNPVMSVDPTGMYTFESSSDKNQQKAFEEGLERAKKSLESDRLTPDEKKEIQRALDGYGSKGEDNGVTVAFGPNKDGAAASADPSVVDDGKGGIRANVTVTFDSSKVGNDDQFAGIVAHEGSHVADYQEAVQKTDKTTLAVSQSPGNITHRESETKAHRVEADVLNGLPRSPGGKPTEKKQGAVIFDPKWSSRNFREKRDAGIKNQLTNNPLYPETKLNQKLIP